MKAVLVRPGNEPELVEVDDADRLGGLQKLVGGFIEAIASDDDPSWTGYVNEDGKTDGLAENPVGTRLAKTVGWAGFQGDYLVGPVVFVGGMTEDGDDTDVTPELMFAAGIE
jgi:hypothetical protein